MKKLSLFLLATCLATWGLLPKLALADPPIACPTEPTDMSMVYGDLVVCTLETGGDTDLFRFTGAAGEVILIVASRTAGSVNPCILLISPSNSRTQMCAGDSNIGNGNATALDVPLTESGEYVILLSETGNNHTGDYTLALERLVPPSPSADSLVPGLTTNVFDNRGDQDVFFMAGDVNDIVRFTATRASGCVNPCVTLIAPDNSRVSACAGDSNICNGNAIAIDAVLDQSGTYAVTLGENGRNHEGSYTLDFQCIFGACNDRPSCSENVATIVGTDGDNIITGTEDRDVISAQGGNDIIYGLGGNDVICGDAGNDMIFGGEGKDRLLGGRGNDMLFGEAGEDKLVGSAGNDLLDGGDDDDNLNGGSGRDVCDGGAHIVSDAAVACELAPNVP